MYFSAIGQDSHRFCKDDATKPLMLGGVVIPGAPGLEGNSDADVILHALCNAISGLSGTTILGAFTDKLCKEQGITDSRVYVQEAVKTLGNIKLLHVSMTLEAKRPHLAKHVDAVRESVAALVGLTKDHVMLTATSGEALTDFGRGEGIQAFVIASGCKGD